MSRTFSIIILISAVLIISCNRKAYLFTSFREPAAEGLRLLYSYDGLKWKDYNHIFLKPEVGNQKVMRDPSMVQSPDGVFHLVWTSSWRGDKGFGYASSRDLIHWSQQQLIPVMAHESTTVNVWAPEIFYDKSSNEYLIIWASCVPGRFEKKLEEDSNNHRMYLTTTRDFKSFTPTRLFLDPGFSVIDAVIVDKSPKEYVLILKDNTRPERNLKVAFSPSAEGQYNNVSNAFTSQFTEGPSYVKIKNEWLIYYDAYQRKTYEAVSTTDFKSFISANDRIKLPEGHKHGTIVTVRKKLVTQLLKKLETRP